jgi:hypothetical protein
MFTTCPTARLSKPQKHGRTDVPLADMRLIASALDFAQILEQLSLLSNSGLADRSQLASV